MAVAEIRANQRWRTRRGTPVHILLVQTRIGAEDLVTYAWYGKTRVRYISAPMSVVIGVARHWRHENGGDDSCKGGAGPVQSRA